jgi:hypothetical protein
VTFRNLPGAATSCLCAQFARYCKVQAPEEQTFLGYTKELVAATEPMLVARTDPQPPEYKRHGANLRKAFKDILCDNIPPGLPPVSRLRDGRILEHAIPLKPTARPQAKQPYRLSETELTEVRTQITTLVNQGWIRPSLGPWGVPVLFQRKKDGKLRMCIDYRALNHHTVKHAYPMPRIEELLQKLRSNTCCKSSQGQYLAYK